MLTQLLEYDFRALNRTMIPLQSGVLLATIVGSLVMRFTLSGISNSSSYFFTVEDILMVIARSLTALVFVAVVASSYVTLFLVARHFYQSFFQEDGYLSFTLPVTAAKSLLSKTIVGWVWLLVNATIIIFGILFLSLVGFASEGIYNVLVWDAYSTVFSYFGDATGIFLIIEIIIFGLVTILSGLLQVFTSLTIGSVVAKTHKVLAGIGIYIAINIGVSTVVSIVSALFGVGFSNFYIQNQQYNTLLTAQAFILPSMLVYGALVVVFFMLSRHLITTKLNLD